MHKISEKTILFILNRIIIVMVLIHSGCSFSNVQVEETKPSLRWRQEQAVKKIIKDLEGFQSDSIVIVNSIFKGFDKEVVFEVRKEIRGKVEPGLATEPLKENVGKLRGLLKNILRRYWVEDAVKFKELLRGIDGFGEPGK